MGYYTSLSGSKGSRQRSRSVAGTQRQLASAAKAEQAQELQEAIESIRGLHRVEFPVAEPRRAWPPEPVDRAEIQSRHKKAALRGIGLFQRQSRREAKARADSAAQVEIAARIQHGIEQQERLQANLDMRWAQLLDNEPSVVIEVLAEAFEDNDAAAAPVGVTDAEAAVVVLVPNESTLPQRLPTTTSAGNLSLRKMTKSQSADLYKALVCGHVLVTVKEALATAPGLHAVRVVALRDGGWDSYGSARAECVLAARFTRESLNGVLWNDADAASIVHDAADELLIKQQGAAKALATLDLSNEADIRELLAAVDLDDLSNP